MIRTLSLTQALVEKYVHARDLSSLIISFVKSVKRDWQSVATIGEYETCMSCPNEEWDLDDCLCGACMGGHIELAEQMILKGAANFSWGLFGACEGGHLDLAERMLSKTTPGDPRVTNVNFGLAGACKGGRLELAERMIAKGAADYSWGLNIACDSGYLELAKLLIFKGARDFDDGLYWACKAGHLELIELMISHGASTVNLALYRAPTHPLSMTMKTNKNTNESYSHDLQKHK